MFFSTSPLPFCRQLINTKQSGDIEVSFTNKVRKLKKNIKSSSDKEKIKELELKLAKLIAKAEQDKQGAQAMSDSDLERAMRVIEGKPKRPFRGMAPTNAPDDFFMTDEEMAELRAGASQRDLEQGKYRNRSRRDSADYAKKGGGKIYASTDKKYGGGIFPRKGKM